MNLAPEGFPRRTATPGRMAPWFAEMARSLGGLVASYTPGGPIDPRTRERVILAVTEVNGCRYCAWIHGGWQEFLGDVDAAETEDILLAYARASAEAGRPLPTDELAELLPLDVVAAVRATVAQIEIANLVGNTVDSMLARLTRRQSLRPSAFAGEAATVAVALPVAVPMLALGGTLRLLNRWAPPLPEVEAPPPGEANLLAHLLTAAVPTFLANAIARAVVLRLPVTLTIGVRAGRTTATLRVGRGKVAVQNGVAPDVVVVVEGEVEPLLEVATGSILREFRSIRLRGS